MLYYSNGTDNNKLNRQALLKTEYCQQVVAILCTNHTENHVTLNSDLDLQ